MQALVERRHILSLSVFSAAATVVSAVFALSPPPAEAYPHGLHKKLLTATMAQQLGGPMPVPRPAVPQAELRIRSVLNGEVLRVVPFDAQGHPNPKVFGQINRFFRSARGSQVDIDPRLIELLLMLNQHYPGRVLTLISGHRDPGGRTSKKSYHVRGQAADIAVPGVSARKLYKVAKKLGARGTGLYPKFVHLDVRTVTYRWTGR